MQIAPHTRLYHTIRSALLGILFAIGFGLYLSPARAQTLNDALDDGLSWTSGGASGWYGQTSYTHDGVDATSTGSIGDRQETWMETSVNGPGLLKFWWKISSEAGFDFLHLVIDGATNTSISGEIDWLQQTNYLANGPHTIRWIYAKDKAYSSGQDRGFVDQVDFITPAAVITSQPQGIHRRQGSTVALAVEATGDFLNYQWRCNGSRVAGGTTSTLTLSNVLATQSGAYDVVITNIHNSVTSAVAVVDIYVGLPLPARPTRKGVVLGWGGNWTGQLNAPADLTNAVSVAAGSDYSVALRSDGTLAFWGNAYPAGSCISCVPPGLSNVVAISAGYYHVVALKDDGTVVSWGYGADCRPCVPAGLSNVVSVSAGTDHSFALRDDGTIAAWGGNSGGQLNIPTNLLDATAIVAGYQTSLALRKDGTVLCWGRSDSGMMNIPQGAEKVSAIASSCFGYAAVALRQDSSVIAWGSLTSDNVPNLKNISSVYAGGGFDAALRTDGTVAIWGPTQIPVPPTLNNIVSFAAGSSFALGVVTIPLTGPADLIASEGADATFSVTAQGPGDFTYGWHYNGVPIPGATNSTLTLHNVSLANAGSYTVRVLTDDREALSRPAKLTVTPRNDSFSARTVTTGGGGRFYGNTTTASAEPGEPNHADAYGGHSLWYQWTAPVDGLVTIDTIGSTFDTVLAVYKGDTLASLILQAADDDGANFNHNSLLTLSCKAGTTYLIAVDGFLGATGGVILNITPQLDIHATSLSPSGSLDLSIFAPGGRKVALETSTNLRTWSAVGTNVAPADGVLRVLQPGGGAGRFFRAHLITP